MLRVDTISKRQNIIFCGTDGITVENNNIKAIFSLLSKDGYNTSLTAMKLLLLSKQNPLDWSFSTFFSVSMYTECRENLRIAC